MAAALENTNELIQILNDLVKINNDRTEGFEKAERQASNVSEILPLVAGKSLQSERFAGELNQQIKVLGGDLEVDTSVPGKIFRVWMDVKNVLNPEDDPSILRSCEFGEDSALAAYKEVLDSDIEMPETIRQLILNQQATIRKSYDEIKEFKIQLK